MTKIKDMKRLLIIPLLLLVCSVFGQDNETINLDKQSLSIIDSDTVTTGKLKVDVIEANDSTFITVTDDLVVDSTLKSGNIGINTDPTSCAIEAIGSCIKIEDDNEYPRLEANGYGSNRYGKVSLGNARNTMANPLNAQTGYTLGEIGFYGYTGTLFARGATIIAKAISNFGGANTPAKLEFRTVPNGTNSAVLAVTIEDDGDLVLEQELYVDSLRYLSDCETLADDGTIDLPALAGYVEIWVNDGTTDEFISGRVYSDGSITLLPNVNGSVAGTDSDTNLCLYDGGTNAVIKNRLGSQLKICYEFKTAK